MKNKILLSLILNFSILGFAFSQSDTLNAKINGSDNYVDYINKNIKYPLIAIENNIQGRVEYQFVISKTGCIESIEITSDSDPTLNKAVTKLLKKTGCNWTPAMIDNEPVSVSMASHIDFKLDDNKKKKSK